MPLPTLTYNNGTPSYAGAGGIDGWLDRIYNIATSDPNLQVTVDRRTEEKLVEIAFQAATPREDDRIIFTTDASSNDASNNVAGASTVSGLAICYIKDVGSDYVADSRLSPNLIGANTGTRFMTVVNDSSPDYAKFYSTAETFVLTVDDGSANRSIALAGMIWEAIDGTGEVGACGYITNNELNWGVFNNSRFLSWSENSSGANLVATIAANDLFIFRMHGYSSNYTSLSTDSGTVLMPLGFGIGGSKTVAYVLRQMVAVDKVTNFSALPLSVGGYAVSTDGDSNTPSLGLIDTRIENVTTTAVAPPLITWDSVELSFTTGLLSGAQALMEQARDILVTSGHYVVMIDAIASDGFIEFAPAKAAINSDRLLLVNTGIDTLTINGDNLFPTSANTSVIYGCYAVGVGGTMNRSRIENTGMYADGMQLTAFSATSLSSVNNWAYVISEDALCIHAYQDTGSFRFGMLAGRMIAEPDGSTNWGMSVGAAGTSSILWSQDTGNDYPRGSYNGATSSSSVSVLLMSNGAVTNQGFLLNNYPGVNGAYSATDGSGIFINVLIHNLTTDKLLGFMRQMKACSRLDAGPIQRTDTVADTVIGYALPCHSAVSASDSFMLSVGY